MLDCYSEFSPELGLTAGEFFADGYIDGPPRPGKRGGAFCSYTVPSAHPYVMLNYTSRPHDVLVMAHELGHGVHASLARPQGIFQFTTPLTLAETASIFGETIVLERLLERAPDAAGRLDLLAGSLDGAVAAVFRQVAMNRFEHAVHTERRERGELATDRFGELWLETQTELLGDSVDLSEDYALWWSYVPHFMDTPGYVYAYAYGHLLALSVYRRYEEARRRLRAVLPRPAARGRLAATRGARRDRGRGPLRPRILVLGPGSHRAPARGGRGRRRRSRTYRDGDVVEERVALPGGEIELTRPRDPEALLSEEAFEHEEFLPYWAELWTSGVALAHDVVAPLAARRPDARAGLRPGAAEHRRGTRRRPGAGHGLGPRRDRARPPPTRAATAPRSRRSCVTGPILAHCSRGRRSSSCSPPTSSTSSATWTSFWTLLPRLVGERGRILLADPGRAPAERFLESARADFDVTTTMSPRFPRVAIHRLRGRSASAR